MSEKKDVGGIALDTVGNASREHGDTMSHWSRIAGLAGVETFVVGEVVKVRYENKHVRVLPNNDETISRTLIYVRPVTKFHDGSFVSDHNEEDFYVDESLILSLRPASAS
jgi:hypothetical protein